MIVAIQSGWRVARQNGEALIELGDMEAARRFAINWSMIHGPCELSIFDADGSLESVTPLAGPTPPEQAG